MTLREAITETDPILKMYGIKWSTVEGLQIMVEMYKRIDEAMELINDNEAGFGF
jgi:hypothetical protein